jgi:hypothetical protein
MQTHPKKYHVLNHLLGKKDHELFQKGHKTSNILLFECYVLFFMHMADRLKTIKQPIFIL